LLATKEKNQFFYFDPLMWEYLQKIHIFYFNILIYLKLIKNKEVYFPHTYVCKSNLYENNYYLFFMYYLSVSFKFYF
jgi:hypothetical protein